MLTKSSVLGQGPGMPDGPYTSVLGRSTVDRRLHSLSRIANDRVAPTAVGPVLARQPEQSPSTGSLRTSDATWLIGSALCVRSRTSTGLCARSRRFTRTRRWTCSVTAKRSKLGRLQTRFSLKSAFNGEHTVVTCLGEHIPLNVKYQVNVIPDWISPKVCCISLRTVYLQLTSIRSHGRCAHCRPQSLGSSLFGRLKHRKPMYGVKVLGSI